MDIKNINAFTKCFVVSIPNEYINSLFISRGLEDLLNVGMVSNTIVINEATSSKIGLTRRSHKSLIPLELKYCDNETDLNKCDTTVKRLVHIVVEETVVEDHIVFSEDLLFNLQCSPHQCPRLNTMISIYLRVTDEALKELTSLPLATKVVIAPYPSEVPLDASFTDELLHQYFSFKKYLYKNDVFGIAIDEDNTWNINKIKAGYIYFKVTDLQSSVKSSADTNGCFVDSSVTMYQAPNCQGFLPRRSIRLCYKTSFYSLLNNKQFWENIGTHSHYMLPSSFSDIFNLLCNYLKPFILASRLVEGLGLSPMFVLTGANGSGKSMLLQAVSQFFGVKCVRVDCVTVGGVAPGQGEAKLKTIFSQLKNIAPCILHLSNIEFLCQDADNKEDIRVMNCFEQQVKMLKLQWPVAIIATCHNIKSISSNLKRLFLDEITLSTPNCEQRESIISWLYHCHSSHLDISMIKTVASLTSGFVFRDLQVLVNLAFKERFKRYNEETKEQAEFVLTDFTKIITTMHKAYSESIGAPKVPSVQWKDVGGLEHLKKEILRSLRSNMFDSGLKRSGLLLHGPPGTGKTLLAKAVATQCGRNFLSVKGPELLNMYVGQSEHNVRDLFELAKAASPCIIFFDELDSLAPNRGQSGDSGGVMDRVVSQLLAEMDNLGDSGDILILGATNRPDLIDSALLRPGRLDKQLYVGPCEDRSSQLSVLSALTHKMSLDKDIDLQEIVTLLPSSVTGAQLSAVCSTAWLSSARHIIDSGEEKTKTAVIVNRGHFVSALGAVLS